MTRSFMLQVIVMVGCISFVQADTIQNADDMKPNFTKTDEKNIFTVNSSIFDSGEDMYNVSQDAIDYFKGLFDEVLQKFVDNYWYRQSIVVIRQEVRSMPRADWLKFVKAVNSLKKKGLYDKIAAIHRGYLRMNKAHFGANFLGWHRLYILVWEHALQKEVPGVYIPYWDCSMDFDMKDPTKSVVWTERFFGNGNGLVTEGPFANWTTGLGEKLYRDVGESGSLISKEFMNLVLSRKHQRDIAVIDTTSGDFNFSLEIYHNSVHAYVAGQMGFLDEAAEDPVFLVYHAFVDYWWQLFRYQQKLIWGISSYKDYPEVKGDHSGDKIMDPFGTENRWGYLNFFYDQFYRYRKSPRCSKYFPYCRSRYLYCDTVKSRCVSKAMNELYTRRVRSVIQKPVYITHGFYPHFHRKFPVVFIDSRTRMYRHVVA